MILLTLIATAVLALIAAAVILVRKLSGADQSLPVTAEWISDLSTEQYRPMMRLLDSTDIQFLRDQPGYTRAMEAQLRRQRVQVFRGYLRSLNADFRRVSMALKILMTHSEKDRGDLASVLMHQELLFLTGMISIHCRLALYRWGLCTVDVTGLVRIFDQMRNELCSLVPSTLPTAA